MVTHKRINNTQGKDQLWGKKTEFKEPSKVLCRFKLKWENGVKKGANFAGNETGEIANTNNLLHIQLRRN